jgi:ribosomal subunit interface protein
MKTGIKFTGMEHEDALRDYAEKKCESFEKLMSERDYEAAVCDVELKRDTHHQSGDVCTAEVTLQVDGEVYRASKEEQTIEKAIDKVKDDMLEQLRSDKGKAESQYLKGAREAKDMLGEAQ